MLVKATQKPNLCGNWMIYSHTEYTFINFKHDMVTLINTFGHFMASYMRVNTLPKTMVCVTKCYQRPQKNLIHVAIG